MYHLYKCKVTKKSRDYQTFLKLIAHKIGVIFGTFKNKSLPKETLRKTINGEGHGAVAGNASAKNLNRNGSERLNRFALTQSYSAAKLQQNTETTKKKVQNLINNGYILKSVTTEVEVVRNLSKALSIRKSDSSMSYDMKAHSSQEIVRSITDGLLSLLDGNGFVDNYAISEEKEYNYFEKDEPLDVEDESQKGQDTL